MYSSHFHAHLQRCLSHLKMKRSSYLIKCERARNDGQQKHDRVLTCNTSLSVLVLLYDITIYEDRVKITFVGNTDISMVGHGYDKLRQFYMVHFGPQQLHRRGRQLKVHPHHTQVHTPSVLALYHLV